MILFVPFFLTHKEYAIYKKFAYQTSTLLSEIFLFWVRAKCQLRCETYASSLQRRLFPMQHLCVLTSVTQILQWSSMWPSTYRATALLSEMSIFWVRTTCEIWLASCSSKTHCRIFSIQQLCTLCKYGRSAYQTTAQLSKTFLELFRVASKIWLDSYRPRTHCSHPLIYHN